MSMDQKPNGVDVKLYAQKGEKILTNEIANARVYLDQKRNDANDKVIQPLMQQWNYSFQSFPIATTFSSIFVLLSLLPILVFAGFTTFITLTLLGTAAVFCLFWFSVIVGSATVLLLVTLSGAALLGLTATVWGVSMYAMYRLASNIRQSSSLGEGFIAFRNELRQYVADRRAAFNNLPSRQPLHAKIDGFKVQAE